MVSVYTRNAYRKMRKVNGTVALLHTTRLVSENIQPGQTVRMENLCDANRDHLFELVWSQ